MPSRDLIDTAEPADIQIEKYRKITNALMRRIERDTDQTGNAFSLFQRAVALEAEVRSRTRELHETLEDLNRVNERLEAASAVAAEANRAKSRFLAAASHDVMQPLNAAKLFIDSLKATDLDAGQRVTLERVESAFGSVEAILESLLHISRLDTRGARAENSVVPVSHTLDIIAHEFAPLAADQQVDLRYVRCRAWVNTDPVYLRQIVQNLVSNAIRYCEGGRVLLGCRRVGESLRIEVHDTGPGIADSDLSRIFEEFQQLRPSGPGSARDGVGLGLAIVERACRLLHHPLNVQSRVGHGSCFAVTVPRAAPAVDTFDESDATTIALVVTADSVLQYDIEQMLESWRMAVVTAASPDEARDAVLQLGITPDVAVLDARSDHISATAIGIPEESTVLLSSRNEPVFSPDGATSSPLIVDLPVRRHRMRAAIQSIRARPRS